MPRRTIQAHAEFALLRQLETEHIGRIQATDVIRNLDPCVQLTQVLRGSERVAGIEATLRVGTED